MNWLKAVSTIALVFVWSAVQAASPPNLSNDIKWDENPNQSGLQQTFSGVAAVVAAFNNGRRNEETQMGLVPNSLGNLVLPAQAQWGSLPIWERALIILDAERQARGVAYGAVTPLALPFEGVGEAINNLAQAYANYQVVNDLWVHDVPASYPAPFGGTDPWQRINNDPTIGAGCHQFISRAENIAIFAHSSQPPKLPLERSLYLFIYDDSSSQWGHREALFLQDTGLLPGYSGFSDDRGSVGHEGLIGIGIAGRSDGSYDPFGWDYQYQTLVVFEMFDPVPGSACAYNVIATTQSATPQIATPLPGSGTVLGAVETVSWNANGIVPTQWWLYAGSGPGLKDYYDQSAGTSLNTSASGWPLEGNRFYMTLWYQEAGTGAWIVADEAEYTAFSGPMIQSPPDPLTGANATFTWSDGGIAPQQWWLYVGSTLGAKDIVNSSTGLSKTLTVNNLPTDGSDVFVKLWYQEAGTNAWIVADEVQYTAATIQGPEITSPTPGLGTTLGAIETIGWTDTGANASQWWLYAGSAPGLKDYFNQSAGANLSISASGWPSDGTPVYMTLWYQDAATNAWISVNTAEYTTATGPQINSPGSGAVLGATQQISWAAAGLPPLSGGCMRVRRRG